MAGSVLIFGGAVIFAIFATRPPSPLAATDRLFEGLAFRYFAPARAKSDRVVIIGITEETLAALPYRSPIDRKFLADLVSVLSSRNVASIGVDLIFDRPTEPAKDVELKNVLQAKASHVVLADIGKDIALSDDQRQYLETFLAGQRTGLANLPQETVDSVVRSYAPQNGGRLSFAGALAAASGVEAPSQPFPIQWLRTKSGRPFAIYPAHLVAMLPPEWLHNKIAVIGTLIPGQDEHRTPISIFAQPLYGVEIHAHALAQILERRAVAAGHLHGVASVAATALIGMSIGLLSGAAFIAGFGALVFLTWASIIAVISLGGPIVLPLAPTLSLALGAGCVRFWRAGGERRDRKILTQLFSRFVNEAVLRELWKERELYLKGGRPRPQRLVATVLFSDIAGFTSYTEKLDPELLYDWLDRYIDAMVGVITSHDGIVLRFVGDGILAIFGAPLPRRSEAEIDLDAQRAVKAALIMTLETRRLNAEWRKVDLPPAIIRVGIYTGALLAGSVGSGSHMEYVLQGDAVNTAARLEAAGKNYLGDDDSIIIVGETTFERLFGRYAAERVGDLTLKGKEKTTTLYRILSV
jgi:adenylate cyclase